jgi:hypothetical protein
MSKSHFRIDDPIIVEYVKAKSHFKNGVVADKTEKRTSRVFLT